MMHRLIIVLGLCGLVLPAMAQEYITTDGRLSDSDFYRIVSCAAPPGKSCQKDIVRWRPSDAKDLTVAVVDIKSAFPQRKVAPALDAIDQAISEINKADANLRLRRVRPEQDAHITVHLWNQREGEPIKGTGLNGLDGNRLGSGYVYLWWDGNKNLTRGVILLARDIAVSTIGSIVLEELTQAMGLLTDINNPWYHTRSIFSENANIVTVLQPQDIQALRKHYPKN